MHSARVACCHKARPFAYFLCVLLLLAGTISIQWGSFKEELRWTLMQAEQRDGRIFQQESSNCPTVSGACKQKVPKVSTEVDTSNAFSNFSKVHGRQDKGNERQYNRQSQVLKPDETNELAEEGKEVDHEEHVPVHAGLLEEVTESYSQKESLEGIERQRFERQAGQESSPQTEAILQAESNQESVNLQQQSHAEDLTTPNRCHAASLASKEPFFSHCIVPDQAGANALDAYIDKRLSTYSGNPDCQEGLIEFHCLEYAARQTGWCNWTLAQDVKPPPDENFLVRPTKDLSSSPIEPATLEEHRLIFYYPSYAFLSILERSISALQHPNHVFMISVDEPEYADAAFVSETREIAMRLNALYFDNVFLVQQDRVIYETSTQILTAWPFLAWSLEQVAGWTHFVLLDAQTYPVVSNEKLREVLWKRRDKIIFAKTPYEISTGPDWEGDQRRYEEVLPYCEGDTDERHVYSQQASKMGHWTDEQGQLRDGYHRVDWLDLQVGTGWEFGKTGGNMVVVPRTLVEFLVRSPEAKMWVQYFKFMVNANEHTIVSIVHYYFRQKVATDYSSCFMLWGGGPENVVLREEDIQNMTSRKPPYLFARKFRLPESLDLLTKIDEELRQ